MARRISGILVFSLGFALAAWVAYNLLIQVQPDAEGRSPLGAVLLAALFMWVGVRWIRGRQAG
jgi:hypothetical protein